MTYSKYPSYTKNNTPWLHLVPTSWQILSGKRLFERRKTINTGMQCSNRLALTMQGVLRRSLEDVDGLQATDYAGYQIFERGDLAFKLIDLQNIKTSRVGFVPERGIMSPAYIRVARRHSHINTRYFYWFYYSLYLQNIFNSLGGGVRQTLGAEELLELPVCVPSQPEQRAIAMFLDRETAKIDRLIEKQERLIALLEEKRQAEISHAVTKGLNPNAPMKNSLASFIGTIPAHWQTSPVKRALQYVTSGSRGWSEYVSDTGPLFVQSGDIGKDMNVTLSNAQRVCLPRKAEGKRTAIKRFDILICITGGRTGSVGLISEDNEEAYVNQHIALTRADSHAAYPPYLAYCLYSHVGQEHFARSQYGLKEGLGLEDVKNTVIPLPPLEEQLKIATWLDQRVKIYSQGITSCSKVVSSLQSKRASLISAAVTGKIDVRGLVEVGDDNTEAA
ncbi:restriction endonuclease subunit S [Kordiimonas sp.]|uniref:restriction endonuclease subunit S n=1 Tax=Kordiimonas sp. TaxID=1970157 RepID=UPI003A9013A8